MDAKDYLFIGLGIALLLYGTTLIRGGFKVPTALEGLVGFVTAFFDTLGIGSFATTTAAYKLRQIVPVKQIPGTMNVGHTLATIAQAFIYTKIVPVESETLIPMIAAACRRLVDRRRGGGPLAAAHDSDRHGRCAARRRSAHRAERAEADSRRRGRARPDRHQVGRSAWPATSSLAR